MSEMGLRYLHDLYAQPARLAISLQALARQCTEIQAAGRWLAGQSVVDIIGIGSSYNAAFALHALLMGSGKISRVVDASEQSHARSLHEGIGRIIVSRSGASVEIVQAAERCRAAGAPFVAITNTPDSPLARLATYLIVLDTEYDHLISLGMYTALVQALLVLGGAIRSPGAPVPVGEIGGLWDAVAEQLDGWRGQLDGSDFFGEEGSVYYMLGRGAGLAAAHEGRLLMEECSKCAATVMTTGSFRHGPQEVLSPRFRGVLWLPDESPMREYDLALAESITALGGRCMLVGAGPAAAHDADLVLALPPVAGAWRPLVEVIPLQLGAYVHAIRTGKNPDELAYCPYIVTTEGAL